MAQIYHHFRFFSYSLLQFQWFEIVLSLKTDFLDMVTKQLTTIFLSKSHTSFVKSIFNHMWGTLIVDIHFRSTKLDPKFVKSK